jgi:methionyl aminopeptidase
MEKEILEKYKKAESISTASIELTKNIVKEDAKVLDIAESIEKKIVELGGDCAFPVNISINEDAAHYTPDINDSLKLAVDDLVKIDVGVQVDGYIWDRAFSVCIGSKSHPLIKISEKALQEAIKMIKPGTKVFEISEVVENTITAEGFNPIHNLCGHGLEQYNQHASPTIPNGKNTIKDEIKAGQVIAMEVFTTDGAGLVTESSPTLIYRFRQTKPVRMIEARKILDAAEKKFNMLPFAKRWLVGIASPVKIDMALKQLVEVDALTEYPILKEESNAKVAQTEETIIVL